MNEDDVSVTYEEMGCRSHRCRFYYTFLPERAVGFPYYTKKI